MAADGDGVAVAVVLGDDVEDGGHEDVAFVFLEALVGGGHFETLGEGLDVDAGGGNGSEVAPFEDPCVDESFGVDVDSHGGGNDEYVGVGLGNAGFGVVILQGGAGAEQGCGHCGKDGKSCFHCGGFIDCLCYFLMSFEVWPSALMK